jgi:hypothetical protein
MPIRENRSAYLSADRARTLARDARRSRSFVLVIDAGVVAVPRDGNAPRPLDGAGVGGHRDRRPVRHYTTSTRTAPIFVLEPVFAWITSYLPTGEALSARAAAGADPGGRAGGGTEAVPSAKRNHPRKARHFRHF